MVGRALGDSTRGWPTVSVQPRFTTGSMRKGSCKGHIYQIKQAPRVQSPVASRQSPVFSHPVSQSRHLTVYCPVLSGPVLSYKCPPRLRKQVLESTALGQIGIATEPQRYRLSPWRNILHRHDSDHHAGPCSDSICILRLSKSGFRNCRHHHH